MILADMANTKQYLQLNMKYNSYAMLFFSRDLDAVS